MHNKEKIFFIVFFILICNIWTSFCNYRFRIIELVWKGESCWFWGVHCVYVHYLNTYTTSIKTRNVRLACCIFSDQWPCNGASRGQVQLPFHVSGAWDPMEGPHVQSRHFEIGTPGKWLIQSCRAIGFPCKRLIHNWNIVTYLHNLLCWF